MSAPRLIGEHLAAERYAREAGKAHGAFLNALVFAAVILAAICAVGTINALEEQEQRFQMDGRV